MRRPIVVALMVLLALSTAIRTGSTFSTFSGATSNTASSFSAASGFCQSQSITWLTGFESGVIVATGGSGLFDSQSTAGGTAAVDTAVTRSGNYSLKIAKTNAGTEYVSTDSTAAVSVRRFAIRFQTLPTADVAELARISALAGSNSNFGYNLAANKFIVTVGSSNALSSMTVSTGVWYVIDWRYNAGADPRVADWRINGVSQTSVSHSGEANSTVDRNRTGSNNTGDVFTAYYDDLAQSTTSADYPLSDGRILGLSPSSVSSVTDPSGFMRTDTNVAVTAGGTAWQRLDEVPLTSLTDYIKQTAVDTSAIARFGFADTSRNACIDAVYAVADMHSSGITANSAQTNVLDGATSRSVYNGDMSPGSGTHEYHGALISPATGTWSATKLNGLVGEVGRASSVGSLPYWDALMLEYETIPNGSATYENAVLADSPAGYWRLGETSGTTATAKAGTPNGTYTNGPILGDSSLVGDTDTSVSFDLTDDYVSLGDVYDFAGTASFTYETWINPAAADTNWHKLVSKEMGTSPYNGWALNLRPTTSGTANTLKFERIDNAGGTDGVSSTTVLQPGTWYHVAVTYDGSTMRLYLNGVQEGGNVASTRALADNTTALRIGGSATGAGTSIGGTLDEVAIYTTVLTQTRIQAHYNAGRL
jgi:hypothetical protein